MSENVTSFRKAVTKQVGLDKKPSIGTSDDNVLGPRVLVVDDNDSVRDSVASILEAFGCRVTKAEDGLLAISCIVADHFDLVVTDLELPYLDGYRLCRWLKQESPDTVAVVMTGSDRSEIAHLKNAGVADGWLSKPFDVSDLGSALEKFGMPFQKHYA